MENRTHHIILQDGMVLNGGVVDFKLTNVEEEEEEEEEKEEKKEKEERYMCKGC